MTEHLSQARLDELWDFDDIPGSEERLRAELRNADPESAVASEFATQVARARGLEADIVEGPQMATSLEPSPSSNSRPTPHATTELPSSGWAQEAIDEIRQRVEISKLAE